jgi:sulfatase maturation enzyme AslB (radical SAM superfamily)
MSNDFCRFLSNGYRFKASGNDLTYAPCCWYRKELSVYAADFAEQKQKISKIKEWTEDCSTCKKIELSGVYGNRSPRQRSFYEIPDSEIPDNVPAWIEFSIDDTCNAACVICGPWHSTTWQKQEVKFGIAPSVPVKRTAEHFLADINARFSLQRVRSVSFLGGEPFQSSIPLTVCRQLAQIHGSLEPISVHFQTNGSVEPEPELLSLLQNCGMLRLNFSIDGVADRFEYLRYPLRWQRVQTVIPRLLSLAGPTVYYAVLATLNPLNCLYYDEVEQWAQQMFRGVQLRSIKPNRASGKLDLAHTTPELRSMINQKYGSDHPVSRMFSNLEYRTGAEFMTYINWLDSSRKLDWRTVFPDTVASLSKLL